MYMQHNTARAGRFLVWPSSVASKKDAIPMPQSAGQFCFETSLVLCCISMNAGQKTPTCCGLNSARLRAAAKIPSDHSAARHATAKMRQSSPYAPMHLDQSRPETDLFFMVEVIERRAWCPACESNRIDQGRPQPPRDISQRPAPCHNGSDVITCPCFAEWVRQDKRSNRHADTFVCF